MTIDIRAPRQPPSTLGAVGGTARPDSQLRNVGCDLVGEVDQRIDGLQTEATARGEPLLPPLLALGVGERVGSNWFTDTLRAASPQHSEPFRQQIAADHPLSALNPNLHIGGCLRAEVLGPLGAHWLATFVASKYGSPRHVVKETNLFFAVPLLLRLFPDAPVVVLSRSPLGIASSFHRSGLFGRWRYRDRYAQVVAMTREAPWRTWSPLVPDDAPGDVVALVRLVVLNTVLLADALADRTVTHIAYEAAVADVHATLAALHRILPDLRPSPAASHWQVGTPAVDDTFATTTTKTQLTAVLTRDEAALVRAEATRRLAAAADLAPQRVVSKARTWLSGARHYRLEPSPAATASPRLLPQPAGTVSVCYVREGGLRWRNLLVTNREFCEFLNALRRAGMANTILGTHLLLTEMPQPRGGRIHIVPATGSYEVVDGYDNHPVYWVTWIGAAAFAAHAGAQLPRRAQARTLTAGAFPIFGNTDYRVGDTTPVTEPRPGGGPIHHRVGNLQIWCADGPPNQPREAGLARYLHGAAWNTPGTRNEADRPRARHLLGSSRGVGIRLARPASTEPAAVPVGELAGRLTTWIDALRGGHRSLADLDQLVVDALARSQPDVGLGAHVTAGAGEAMHG